MRKSIALAFLATLLFSFAASADCTFGFLSETLHDAGTNPGDVAAGDFNHDGLDDLAIIQRQSGNVAILIGEQGGTFADPVNVTIIANGFNQADIVAAYMNADNHLDLVVMGGEQIFGQYRYTETHAQVLLGNGNGGFTLGDTELVGYYGYDFVAGDFDNDNDTDIAVSRSGGTAGFNLLLNNGAGVLTQKSLNDTVVDPGPGSWAEHIAAGDFDNDGKLDVVMSDSVNDKVWVFWGIGDGTFTRAASPLVPITDTGHGPGHLAAGDFNGDGYDDIAVTGIVNDTSVTTPIFTVTLSGGSGRTFGSFTSYGTVSGSSDALSHDVNGDDKLDVVVAGSSVVKVFLGAGNGTFTSQTFGSGGLGLAILDIDNDGGADIAATHFGSGKVGILTNVCGQVDLQLTSSANPGTKGTEVTITTSLTSNPAATGTLTLSQTGGGTLGSVNLNEATSISVNLSLEIGTYEFVATYSGDSRFPAETRTLTQTIQAPPFGPPPGFTATSSGGAAQLAWIATSGTDHYEIFRNTGSGYALLGTSSLPAFTDNTAPSNSAIVYKVRAISPSSVASAFSIPDATTTYAYTDPTLQAGVTVVKQVHVTELRTAVDALRVLGGLSPFSWTDSPPTLIKAVHITELRTAVNAARTALGMGTVTFTNGSLVRAVHVNELRAATR